MAILERDIKAMQARVAELEAENAQLRTILAYIADDHAHEWDAVDPQEVWACQVCHIDSQDYAGEVQEKARAWLEAHPAPGTKDG